MYVCVLVVQLWNVLALDGSNWQRVDLMIFQRDIEVCIFRISRLSYMDIILLCAIKISQSTKLRHIHHHLS